MPGQIKARALSDARQLKVKQLKTFARSGSARAHEALFEAFQPLVRFVAYRFNRKQAEIHALGDLVDAGQVGLLDALAQFVPSVSSAQDCRAELARFNALATPLICESIARSIAVNRTIALQHARRLELADKLIASGQEQRRGLPGEVALMLAILRLRQSNEGLAGI